MKQRRLLIQRMKQGRRLFWFGDNGPELDGFPFWPDKKTGGRQATRPHGRPAQQGACKGPCSEPSDDRAGEHLPRRIEFHCPLPRRASRP